MPRSTYVYAVMRPGQIAPMATFTVKREMRLTLESIKRDAPSVLAQLRIYRMDDGPAGMFAEMTVDEILNG